LDDSFNPHASQMSHLASIRRLSLAEVRALQQQYASPSLPSQSFRAHVDDGDKDESQAADDALLNPSSSNRSRLDAEVELEGRSIEIGFGAMVEIPLAELSSRMITRLKRLASFANPEFYKLQRMRMPTYPHQRFVFSGELRETVLLLPRGCLEKAQKTLASAGADIVVRDERLGRKRLKVAFSGKLTDDQEKAVAALASHDTGVLVAPPGAGKTVMGCALIAKRKVTTLVLVHRQPLLEQWKERMQTFLGVGPKEIGVLGGAKKKATGKLDLAMLQTLTRMQDLEEIAESYAQIIIDEAHHIPAASFESIMKRLPARYVVGLTATPYRKDGLERILFQQCGEVRHTIQSTDGGKLQKNVIIRETSFRLREDLGPRPEYHALLHALTKDEGRNRLIAQDVAAALKAGRFPALISDRKEHLELLEKEITSKAKEYPDLASLQIIKLIGDLGKKDRRKANEQLQVCRENRTPTLLLATGSLVGEGFDLPALDTLVIATPLSFKGRMVQYAGRLHRLIEGKDNVLIHDYVDSSVAMCISMYRKRINAYRSMGYQIEEPAGLLGPRSLRQTSLFG
jgi:superfamily II DNA or RNA helicase